MTIHRCSACRFLLGLAPLLPSAIGGGPNSLADTLLLDRRALSFAADQVHVAPLEKARALETNHCFESLNR
jgi:hypothetical protein